MPESPSPRLAAASASFLIAAVVALWSLEALRLPAGARLALALAPVLVFVWFLLEERRWIRSLDEREARIQLEALALGHPLALIAVFAVGSLERAGFALWGLRQPRDLWVLLVLAYFIGLVRARRRYR